MATIRWWTTNLKELTVNVALLFVIPPAWALMLAIYTPLY